MCQEVLAEFACTDRHVQRGEHRTRFKHVAQCQAAVQRGESCHRNTMSRDLVLQEDEPDQDCPECRGETLKMLISNKETRVIIRVCVTDLPGDPRRRHTTLGELFSDRVLHRPIQQVPSANGYDGIVIPPKFDSDKPVRVWFIYDLNVKDEKTKDEILDIPHYVYLATRNGDIW